MRRKGLPSLIGIVVVSLVLLAATFIFDNEPLLGLDLQGGVSVVLQPVEPADDEQLDQAIEIIRQRVDGLGVAEPEISRQGDTILVQIPGVADQDRALELVGQTAELRFRPVLAAVPEDEVGALGDMDLPETDLTDPDAEPTDTTAPDTTQPPETEDPGGEGEESSLRGLGSGEQAGGAAPAELAGPEQSEDPEDTTTFDIEGLDLEGLDLEDFDIEDLEGLDGLDMTDLLGEGGISLEPDDFEITPPGLDEADAEVVLPGEAGGIRILYRLGPTALTGEALEGAIASLTPGTGQWVVLPTFKPGSGGIDLFNEVASRCFAGDPTCPTQQLAITLDGEVVSAPVIQTPSFTRDEVQITGDFTEREARDLALVLRYGALPVELEPQQVQVVSATIGEDALRAGIIAGLVGLALVTLYITFFYRLLGLVAMASLALSFALLWSLISWLGETQGLALTLAGVTGIIVSIGISLDSNVVYFEYLKEDVLAGRTVRSSVERSFTTAFSTIVKADVATLIGAGLLYWLTVGPVRGFALFLGLATILDLVASWFFLRPAVILLGRSRLVEGRPGLLGIPLPEDDPVAPAPVGAG